MNQSSQTWQRSTYHWASANLQALFSWNYLSQASRLIITYFRSKRICHFPWFRSHLTNRSKITSVGDDQSVATEVPLGVPLPGTTTLFNSYKWSPRLSAGQNVIILYADYTEIYYSSKNLSHLEQHINDDLGSVSERFSRNPFILNLSKCSFVIFGSPQKLKRIQEISIQSNSSRIPHGHNHFDTFFDNT